MSEKNKRQQDKNTEKRSRPMHEAEDEMVEEPLDMAELEENGLVFEDPFEDEFEEEELDDINPDENDFSDEENENMEATKEEEATEGNNQPKQVWRPGIDKLPDGEELEYDPSAYFMYHSLRTEWPCLSFDILKDNLGDNRQRVSIIFLSYSHQSAYCYVI